VHNDLEPVTAAAMISYGIWRQAKQLVGDVYTPTWDQLSPDEQAQRAYDSQLQHEELELS